MDVLQTFADSLPASLQWLAVMLVGALPFVESYGGAVLGVASGVPVPVAILAAVTGNVLAMSLTVWIASGIRAKATASTAARARITAPAGGTQQGAAGDGSTDVAAPEADGAAPGRGKRRIRQLFERYGVPGVSLLGQWALPSHITAPTLVGFGASRGSVLVWQTMGILVWGTAFGTLAAAGFNLMMR